MGRMLYTSAAIALIYTAALMWFFTSPHPLCFREGVGSVVLCIDGSYKVEYVNLGGGYDIFKSDGDMINCPVINPDLLDERCFNYIEACLGTNLCGRPVFSGELDLPREEL